MIEYLWLLRPQQWYKNLIIFVAIFFSINLLNINLFIKSCLGFIVLCFISSSYYIINDIVDIEKDKKHPEKNKRPLQSGEIKKTHAVIISGLLLILSLSSAYYLSPTFIFFPIVLFISNILYTLYFSTIAIVDIHFIATNYILRAIAGTTLISVVTSPWLILFIFVSALFLAVGKRKSDLFLLKNDAILHKKVYEVYTEKFLEWISIILPSILFVSYILYTFLSYHNYYMMLTIPFVSFIIFRYLYFVSINHEIARKTEYFFKDKQLIIGLFLWVLSCFLILYLIG